ncbi:hypothetical protein Ancab_035335, partial [Ancistrocladus abbreviatus]
AVMEEYQQIMKGLAQRRLGLMLSSLGLSSEQMEWLKPKERHEPRGPPQAVLQLNSYPVCPDPTMRWDRPLTPHPPSVHSTKPKMFWVSKPNTRVNGFQCTQLTAHWLSLWVTSCICSLMAG